jgi:hypothetical protein
MLLYILLVTAMSTDRVSDWVFQVDSGGAGPSVLFPWQARLSGLLCCSIRAIVLHYDVIAI